MPVTWPLSRQICIDNNGEPAPGAKVFFYLGGTTTALSIFSDASQSTPHTNPVVADGVTGRFPRVYIPFSDDSFDERVTTAAGTELWYDLNIPRLDPIDAATDTIAAEQLIATGHIHFELIQGTKTGYVRCNGRTLGNAASGATERANADTVGLFTYLYNAMANTQAAVSGGRGASAAADYAANKTITLPNARGSMFIGLDDMGNTASASFGTGITFSHGNATTPGSLCGANTTVLLTANMPVTTPAGVIVNSLTGTANYTPTGVVTVTGSIAGSGGNLSVSITDPQHTHPVVYTQVSNLAATGATIYTSQLGGGTSQPGAATAASTGITAAINSNTISASLTWNVGTHTFAGDQTTLTFAGTPFGSGTAFNNLPFAYLGTWFLKL